MQTPEEMMLEDLKATYEGVESSRSFSRLYEEDVDLGHVFAVWHEKLNQHFYAINGRLKSTRHYWSNDSRELISLIENLRQIVPESGRSALGIVMSDDYQRTILACENWLSPSNGSEIPEDFLPIGIVKYESVFSRVALSTKLKKQRQSAQLRMRGEGSHAFVYSYIDPDYDKEFAIKRAKPSLDQRDLARFRREFQLMSQLHCPYIVEVYRYDEDANEYRMEFCEETLREYIRSRNSSLRFGSRKRITLQFLYGLNFIHRRGILHRDISLQNVLMKVFDEGAVLVKLSDFGLAKESDSSFTRTHTELRGTIRDPQLTSLKNYRTVHEIYSVGWIVSYVFTGQESLASSDARVGHIIQKCTDHTLSQRYQSIIEVITDVENLEANP